MSDVTQILSRIERCDPTTAERLLPLVYNEIRQLAAARVAKEQPARTGQPTPLVCVSAVGGDVAGAKCPIERLDIGVLPPIARCDEQGFHVNTKQLTAYRLRRELRTVVRTDVIRNAALHEQIA